MPPHCPQCVAVGPEAEVDEEGLHTLESLVVAAAAVVVCTVVGLATVVGVTTVVVSATVVGFATVVGVATVVGDTVVDVTVVGFTVEVATATGVTVVACWAPVVAGLAFDPGAVPGGVLFSRRTYNCLMGLTLVSATNRRPETGRFARNARARPKRRSIRAGPLGAWHLNE